MEQSLRALLEMIKPMNNLQQTSHASNDPDVTTEALSHIRRDESNFPKQRRDDVARLQALHSGTEMGDIGNADITDEEKIRVRQSQHKLNCMLTSNNSSFTEQAHILFCNLALNKLHINADFYRRLVHPILAQKGHKTSRLHLALYMNTFGLNYESFQHAVLGFNTHRNRHEGSASTATSADAKLAAETNEIAKISQIRELDAVLSMDEIRKRCESIEQQRRYNPKIKAVRYSSQKQQRHGLETVQLERNLNVEVLLNTIFVQYIQNIVDAPALFRSEIKRLKIVETETFQEFCRKHCITLSNSCSIDTFLMCKTVSEPTSYLTEELLHLILPGYIQFTNIPLKGVVSHILDLLFGCEFDKIAQCAEIINFNFVKGLRTTDVIVSRLQEIDRKPLETPNDASSFDVLDFVFRRWHKVANFMVMLHILRDLQPSLKQLTTSAVNQKLFCKKESPAPTTATDDSVERTSCGHDGDEQQRDAATREENSLLEYNTVYYIDDCFYVIMNDGLKLACRNYDLFIRCLGQYVLFRENGNV